MAYLGQTCHCIDMRRWLCTYPPFKTEACGNSPWYEARLSQSPRYLDETVSNRPDSAGSLWGGAIAWENSRHLATRAKKFHTDVSSAKSTARCKKPFDKSCIVHGRAYEVTIIISSQISTHPQLLFANGEIYCMLVFLKIFLKKTPKNCLITLFTDKRKTKM